MRRSTASVIITILVIFLIIWGIYYFATRPAEEAYNPNLNTNINLTGVPNAAIPTVNTKTASFVYSTSAILNGDINPNGMQTAYWYEYGETDALGTTTMPQLVGGGFGTFNAPGQVTGLKANTFYYYRLVAQNQYGKVYGGTLSFKTGGSGVASPRFIIPSALTKEANGLGTTTAILNGSVAPNGSETFYWFEYGKNFSLGSTTPFVTLDSTSGTKLVSANIANLDAGTFYYYRLNAQNAHGTVVGNISIFRTLDANPPQVTGKVPGVVTSGATNVTEVSAVLNGQVNPNGVATNYHFEYGKSTLFGEFTLDQKTPERTAGNGSILTRFSSTLTGLEADTTYYYQLVAENEYGISRGAIFSFTTR
jgi:phosphodiesterase/alkaline phosphatase D-like protein